MFLGLVLANSLFYLRDIDLTLGLLPSRRHVVWRDSVGAEGSGSELKIRVRGYFSSEFFSGCCAILTSPKKGETQKHKKFTKFFQIWSSVAGYGELCVCF